MTSYKENRGETSSDNEKVGFSPARSLLVRLLLCTEKQTEKQHLLPPRGRAAITMGKNPAPGHALLVLHFQAQSPGLTIRNREIRMPKPFNLQLVHLYPNSNLLGFEVKQHMYTHTYMSVHLAINPWKRERRNTLKP